MRLVSLIKRVPVLGPLLVSTWRAMLRLLHSPVSSIRLRALVKAPSADARAIGLAALDTWTQPDIEAQRAILLSDESSLVDPANGAAGPYDANKRICDACAVSKSEGAAQLLGRMVKQFAPTTAIELGTNLGISSAYIARAIANGELTTFEASSNRLRIARKLHHSLDVKNVRYVEGLFSDTLAMELDSLPPIEFAFIDGHHQYQPTLDYLRLILSHSAPGAVFVFDDIRWSSGMRRAWRVLKADNRFSTVVDFNLFGVCVLRKPGDSERVTTGVISIC